MAFEFIHEELCEARFVRTARDTMGRSELDVAEDFFEHLMALQQMRFENPKLAQKYAKDTLRFMNFQNLRTGATDLHNLAAILVNPDKFKDKIQDAGTVRFDELKFKRYLRDVAKGKRSPAFDRTYMLELQKHLQIQSPFLKQTRRVMADYSSSSSNERKMISNRMINVFRADGQYKSDMFKPYVNMIRNDKELQITQQDVPKTGPIPDWMKFPLTVVGAYAAGYQFGKRFL